MHPTTQLSALSKRDPHRTHTLLMFLFQVYHSESALSSHKQIFPEGTEKKLYECEFCTFKSCEPVGLSFHQIKRHKGRVKMSHLCQNCDSVFVSKAALFIHQRRFSQGMLFVQNVFRCLFTLFVYFQANISNVSSVISKAVPKQVLLFTKLRNIVRKNQRNIDVMNARKNVEMPSNFSIIRFWPIFYCHFKKQVIAEF